MRPAIGGVSSSATTNKESPASRSWTATDERESCYRSHPTERPVFRFSTRTARSSISSDPHGPNKLSAPGKREVSRSRLSGVENQLYELSKLRTADGSARLVGVDPVHDDEVVRGNDENVVATGAARRIAATWQR